ncbi:serine/threonine protein phosphatase [Dactylosporangium sp. NPDC005555]|uniref:serine/threonine protein phosphatase n=1 Tax=Dactylosporangium sp. NPDC005555 TaxID=3154889 RepID=UPI0033B581F9
MRLVRYGEVSTALALLDDRRLGRLVDEARPLGVGVGGASAVLDVDGVPVFVKRIPLTDLERDPRHVRSTANFFELPVVCQYSVVAHAAGGFGAWRELAANTMTTNWVLTGRSEAFPLLYHWRVLPGAAPPTEEHADIERVVDYWDGSPAVRRRLRALAEASASLVLFAEYVPHRLDTWLAEQDPEACLGVERQLREAVAFMNGNGLLHLDAHFRNILTDGRRLYLADLGLATSARFDLSAQERAFVVHHANHDTGYASRELVNWIVANVAGITGTAERHDYIRGCAAGARPVGVPETLTALLTRHARNAAVMNDFFWHVYGTSRTTPFPADGVET